MSIEKKLDELTDYQAAVTRKNIEQRLTHNTIHHNVFFSDVTNKSVQAQQMAPHDNICCLSFLAQSKNAYSWIYNNFNHLSIKYSITH